MVFYSILGLVLLNGIFVYTQLTRGRRLYITEQIWSIMVSTGGKGRGLVLSDEAKRFELIYRGILRRK
jgi:hypothetical protein